MNKLFFKVAVSCLWVVQACLVRPEFGFLMKFIPLPETLIKRRVIMQLLDRIFFQIHGHSAQPQQDSLPRTSKRLLFWPERLCDRRWQKLGINTLQPSTSRFRAAQHLAVFRLCLCLGDLWWPTKIFERFFLLAAHNRPNCSFHLAILKSNNCRHRKFFRHLFGLPFANWKISRKWQCTNLLLLSDHHLDRLIM